MIYVLCLWLQVKEVCDQMTEELVGHKAAFTQVKEKEKKSASLVQQLTAMVKEQKSRISQLNKAKNDAVAMLKVQPLGLLDFGFCGLKCNT